MAENKKAMLYLPDGKQIELPILKGTLGPDVLDITSLYKDANVFTYDPGFTSTGSCQSAITFIDGNKGTLLFITTMLIGMVLAKSLISLSNRKKAI